MMHCVWPWLSGPRSRPEVGGSGGGRGGGGLGRALRGPHPGLVEPLSQVLLILSNIVLQAAGPEPHEAREGWEGAKRGGGAGGGRGGGGAAG